MKELTKEEAILALRICPSQSLSCSDCPLKGEDGCSEQARVNVLRYIEKEPAPSANDTSSKNNLSQLNDNTKKVICQAFNRMDKACRTILDIYGTMSEEEQKAFDLGEAFGDMLNVKNELDHLKAGENK